MSTSYRLGICMAICSIVAFGVFAAPTPSIARTKVEQPQTLADAESQYHKDTHVDTHNDASSYDHMAEYFSRHEWYERTIEICDEIAAKWPNDKASIIFVQLTKAKALGGLNQFDKAEETLNELSAHFKADNTLNWRGIPYKYEVLWSVLTARSQIYSHAKKYHEAADARDKLMSLLQSEAGRCIWENRSADYIKMNIETYFLRTAAYYHSLAGDFEIANKQYDDNIHFIEKSPLSDEFGKNEHRDYALLHYILYAEKAENLIRGKQYAEALQILLDLEQKCNEDSFRKETFLAFTSTDVKAELEFNDTIA